MIVKEQQQQEIKLNNIALLLEIWFVDNSWVLAHDSINALMRNNEHIVYSDGNVESLIIKVWLHYYGGAEHQLWEEEERNDTNI